MKTNNYKPVLPVFLLLLALVVPFHAAAQESSLLSGTTASIFGNDIDNFMDPNDYDQVEFENFFSALQYAGDISLGGNVFQTINDGSDVLLAGFAKRFGSNYLGLYYMGNIFESQKNVTAPGAEMRNIFNNVGALIGSPSFGGIGFGAGMQTFKSEGVPIEEDHSVYTFNASWGKNFVLSNGTTLKPEIGLAFSKPSSDFEFTFGDDLGYFDDIPNMTYTLDYIIAADLGTDWVLDPKTAAERVWSFGYSLALTSITMGVGPLEADSMMHQHMIGAKYKQIHDLTDQFSAGFSAGATIAYSKAGIEVMGVDVSGSSTGIVPEAGAAFTYRFNSPFSLNAGVNVYYPIWRSSYTGGNSDTYYQGFDVRTTAGGTFQPHPSLAIDLSLASGTGYYDTGLDNIKLAVRFKK